MQIKGDITVKRTGIFDRRADQGLAVQTISGTLTLVRHDAYWQDVTATGAQDVVLPVATTLPKGWEIVVNAETGGNLTVVNSAITTIQVVTAGLAAGAFKFTCVDNGSAAGVWYVTSLDLGGAAAATRYVKTYNATSDWGAAGGGLYTIAVTEATHGRGVNPNIQFYENVGSGVLHEVTPQDSILQTTGNHTFTVPDSPDLRFAGQTVYV